MYNHVFVYAIYIHSYTDVSIYVHSLYMNKSEQLFIALLCVFLSACKETFPALKIVLTFSDHSDKLTLPIFIFFRIVHLIDRHGV